MFHVRKISQIRVLSQRRFVRRFDPILGFTLIEIPQAEPIETLIPFVSHQIVERPTFSHGKSLQGLGLENFFNLLLWEIFWI